MKEILEDALRNRYAVGFFNAVDVEQARSVINTAEDMRSPIIVGTAEVLLPATPLNGVAEYLLPMAQKARVPVCVHFDHGLSFSRCIEAIKLGFTSVMYDCSVDPYEQNVAKVAEMVRICHSIGITVEGELGHVGDNEGSGKLMNPSDYFTDPDTAADFVERTGIDALAVAVGNAHGDYKLPPKLDFERITAISKITGIPLVLHGGSGLSDDDFHEAIKRGISKINIFTDIDRAGKKGIEKGLADGAQSLSALMPYMLDAMRAVTRNKIELFGSANRA
jgi:fructose-bisphosphate aldolase class II